MKKTLTILFLLINILVYAQQKNYRCFEGDANPSLKLSVEYVDDEPTKIIYKGKKTSLSLKKIKASFKTKKGSASYSESYNEILTNGKAGGKYTFTHEGNYDYVLYEKNDGKKFKFTINIDESLNANGDGYRTTPCF